MRYIDEVRVPDFNANNLADWAKWIDQGFVPPHLQETHSAGLEPTAWEGAVQYRTGPDRQLVLRYGPRVGYAINPEGPLDALSMPPPGPLFMLDFDSFWQPLDIPDFDPVKLIEVCDELRTPVRTRSTFLQR